jgi:DNA-binding MarR family transcriptional regulator
MPTNKEVYRRFVNLMIGAEHLCKLPSLDPTEKRILQLLVAFWERNQPITVIEAMNMTDEISTSTSFRYLKKLRQKGYLTLEVDDYDNRVKYVKATEQADQYFSHLGRLMVKATN